MDTLNEDLNQGLLSELECPVCMEYMLPPIKFCENGHNICFNCKPKLKECPTCRQPFVKIRNLALENISRKVKYPCINKNFGCKETHFMDSLPEHQAACNFIPFSCTYIEEKECSWAGVLNHLKEHLFRCHKEEVREQDGATNLIINIDSLELKGCKVMFAFNEIFYIHIQRRLNNYYIAVRYVGTTENALEFGYKICFKKSNSVESIMVCHVPRSVTEELDAIFESGNCFKLPYELLKRFVTQASNLPYKLEIFKV